MQAVTKKDICPRIRRSQKDSPLDAPLFMMSPVSSFQGLLFSSLSLHLSQTSYEAVIYRLLACTPYQKQCRTPRESPSSEVSLCSYSNYWVSVKGCFVGAC